MDSILVESFDGKNIALKGVGKMFYQDGFPLTMIASELNKKNIEISPYHLVEELWNNGWEWKTIERKLKEEIEDSIECTINIDIDNLHKFYDCLEQPKRANGGYEESREMIYNYLFPNTESSLNFVKNKLFKTWLQKLK